jgi:ABC-type transporter Mla subunit MlaD
MDRLTQLQQEMDRIAQLHSNSIGLLQRDAPPADDGAATTAFHDNARTLARQLVQAHAFVDELLTSLPAAEHASAERQLQRIAALDAESAGVTAELQRTIAESEAWLEELRAVLTSVGEQRFQMSSGAPAAT